MKPFKAKQITDKIYWVGGIDWIRIRIIRLGRRSGQAN